MPSFHKIFKAKKEQERKKECSCIVREENGIQFTLITDVVLGNDDIKNVINIVNANVGKGISGNITAKEISEKLSHQNRQIAAVDIYSSDQGKKWLIKMSDHPLAFR